MPTRIPVRPSTIARVAILISLAAVIVVTLMWPDAKRHSTVRSSAAGSSPLTAISPQGSVSSSKRRSPSTVALQPLAPALRDQLDKFVAAYFWVKPADSAVRRQASVAQLGFVQAKLRYEPAYLLSTVPLAPMVIKQRTNKTKPLTVGGSLYGNAYSHADALRSEQLDVTATLVVTLSTTDGSIYVYPGGIAEYEQPCTSTWVLSRTGVWQLTSFATGGDE